MNIKVKSFISSLIVIFALMVCAYVGTLLIPGGEYARIIVDGNSIIDANSFHYVEGGIPLWKWLLSPFLVLGADGGITIILVIVFILVIGAVFNVLNDQELIKYLINKIAYKYGNKRYLLVAILILVFMLMGAFIGSFEEVVPLVPIVVSLMIMLGFDVFIGLSTSLIAVCCGFACGIMNPFTVGVAQSLAGVQMYSGAWLRVVAFVIIYCLLLGFVYLYSRKIRKPAEEIKVDYVYDKKKDKAISWFLIILLIGIALIVSSAFLTFLQDYTMVIVALMFLVGGIVAGFVSGISFKKFFKSMLDGVLGILPAVLMILMASSIKYTLTEAHVLDTIMHFAVGVAENLPKAVVIIFIYLIVLVMNFFIGSGSAKAFLLIPLIVPLGQLFEISAQLCILAFIFGDGFSNVVYPTNPVLLISLGLTDTPYHKYFKFSWLLELMIFAVTIGLLLLGLTIGY